MYRWKDSIKTGVTDVGWEGVDCGFIWLRIGGCGGLL
jgi:hypothetical protein